MVRNALLGLVGTAVTAAALLAPTPAEAYWERGWGWRAPVVVVGPPRVAYVPVPFPGPRPAFWVRPHYNRFGMFVPGHWQ